MERKSRLKVLLILIICLIAVIGITSCSSKGKTNRNTDIGTTVAPEKGIAPQATEPEEKSSLAVDFSAGSGVYEEAMKLELSCDSDADIYYTTDGSNPITSSTRYLYTAPVDITDRSDADNYVSAVDPFLFDGGHMKPNATKDGYVGLMSAPAREAVDKCTVIRAVALDKKGLYSEIQTNTYFVGSMTKHIQGIEDSCEAAGTGLAVISISINYDDLFDPETGIYVKGNIYNQALADLMAKGTGVNGDASRKLPANYNQRGKEWERKIHIDYFESDGATTTCELQQDCGIRIQGNFSRSDLLKGFRLYAREKYGTKYFDYPIFGDELKNDNGETIDQFKTLTLRNGGNAAFMAKYNDTYWQSLVKEIDCETQTSRPCVVYIDGEYWGLYVLQEDYSKDYFEQTHGVNSEDVVAYKGDGETYEIGFKLDLGELPEGETNVGYYYYDLWNFFQTHKDLREDADYEEFAKLVDVESARDYFAVQIWINNKWDWPFKNWEMWRTTKIDDSNPYADGRWRFCFYDLEFGGFDGMGDAFTNTIESDGNLLSLDYGIPAVLTFSYLMSNEKFREDFKSQLLSLNDNNFSFTTASKALINFKGVYSPLYDQFFSRYPDSGASEYSDKGQEGSYQCLLDFLSQRGNNINQMIDYIDNYYASNN